MKTMRHTWRNLVIALGFACTLTLLPHGAQAGPCGTVTPTSSLNSCSKDVFNSPAGDPCFWFRCSGWALWCKYCYKGNCTQVPRAPFTVTIEYYDGTCSTGRLCIGPKTTYQDTYSFYLIDDCAQGS